eukprot:1140572-Pelagomonas_calceolata.AAC.3
MFTGSTDTNDHAQHTSMQQCSPAAQTPMTVSSAQAAAMLTSSTDVPTGSSTAMHAAMLTSSTDVPTGVSSTQPCINGITSSTDTMQLHLCDLWAGPQT